MTRSVEGAYDLEFLFSSGHVADLILVLMLVEGIALTLLYRARGIGIDPASLWANLFAGAALVLALRSVITGAGWPTTAVFLVLGLMGHGAELLARWRK